MGRLHHTYREIDKEREREAEIMNRWWETRLTGREGRKRAGGKNRYQRISPLAQQRFSLTYQRAAAIFKFIPF